MLAMAGPATVAGPAPPAGAQPDYQAEAAVAREHLSRLRSSLMRRALNRRNTETEAVRGRLEQPVPLTSDETKFLLEQVVARVVGSYLLDPRVVLPLPVEIMHKQLLQSANGDKYSEALAALGLDSPLPMVAKLASADAKWPIDVQQIDVSGHIIAYVTRVDRQNLVSFTGVDDPLAQPAVPPNVVGAAVAGVGGGAAVMMGPGGLMGPPGMMGPPMMPPLHGPGSVGAMMMMHGPRPGMPDAFGPMGGMMGGLMMGPGGMLPPGAPPGMFPPGALLPGGGAPGMMPGFPGGEGMDPNFKRPPGSPPTAGPSEGEVKRPRTEGNMVDLESLLGKKSVQERVKSERGEELLDILAKPSAKEHAALTKFRTAGGSAIREHCPLLTKEACRRSRQSPVACHRLHFRKVLHPWTDPSLGNCSYLDTCRNQRTCRFVHYELDADVDMPEQLAGARKVTSVPKYLEALDAPQWLRCDVRTLDMSVLGKFGVIMADPPWEIHQHLPYGTMADDEMRNMNIGVLQDDGVIFLWVTGRAMELGRECLQIWGYKRVDELVWIKTNQLQRLIRTGRTGHWLNHSKEHCLIGLKGNPQLNRYVDCDVVVAEVRETSRKPDEMYPLLERLSPGTRKLEIFARGHNLKPGWVGLGNQLDGSSIRDPVMRDRFEARYPVGHPERDAFGLKPL